MRKIHEIEEAVNTDKLHKLAVLKMRRVTVPHSCLSQHLVVVGEKGGR